MEKISQALSKLELRKGDIYIYDYSEATKELPKEEHRHVEIHEDNQCEINGLCILNPKQIAYYSANLEHPDNEGLFYHPVTKKKSLNCEALCVAASSPGDDEKLKQWILFAELKYCLAKNEVKNLRKAYRQLRETQQVLFTRGNLTDSKYRKYFVMSLPDNSEVPFDSFIFDSERLEKIKAEYGVTVLGSNTVEIISKSRIREVLSDDQQI